MKNKKGFALITVIFIGALIFTSIMGMYIRLVPERNIFVNRVSIKRALSAVEACINQINFDLRNADFKNNKILPENVFHYLSINDIKNIIKNLPGYVIELDEIEFSTNPYVTYKAKIIRKILGKENEFTGIFDPDEVLYNGNSADLNVYIGIYAIGNVYRDNTKSDLIARKAIYSEVEVVYRKEISIIRIPGNSDAVNYAIFSGTNIIYNGDAQTVNGDIYANGMIDLGKPKKVRVKNGTAYAHGSITGNGIAENGAYANIPEKPFPMLNKNYYINLAYNFKNGLYPYDGTEPNFPNTNYSEIINIIYTYLGSNNYSEINNIKIFYNDLKNKTGLFTNLDNNKWLDLKNKARNIVYYIQGNTHIAGNFEAEGTFVIDGDLIINANSEIRNPGGLAFLVDGDINRANGTAYMEGLFYSTGSLTGQGTFDLKGGIITKGSVDLNGNFNITYVPMTEMDTLSIETEIQTQSISITKAEITSSSWREISIDEFENPTL